MKHENISILLVDDHDAVLEGITLIINKYFSGIKIYKALTPEKALFILQKEEIDLAIVDISFKNIDDNSGIYLCKEIIKNQYAEVISFTGFYQTNNLKKLMLTGVDKIVSKNDGSKALIEAIITAINKETFYYSNEIQNEFPNILAEKKELDKNIRQLTNRQKEIIDLIALSKTNKQIADELSLTVKTIEGHIANIARKLGLEKADRISILRKLGRIIK